jgi:hypothetical protein
MLSYDMYALYEAHGYMSAKLKVSVEYGIVGEEQVKAS